MTPSKYADLETLFQPWVGGADDDQLVLKYSQLDPNDKSSVMAAFRADLLPHFEGLPTERRVQIVSSLIDVQALQCAGLERFWESMLPPFSLPDTPHSLFRWITDYLKAS